MMTALGSGVSPQACRQARIKRLSRRRHSPSRVQRANSERREVGFFRTLRGSLLKALVLLDLINLQKAVDWAEPNLGILAPCPPAFLTPSTQSAGRTRSWGSGSPGQVGDGIDFGIEQRFEAGSELAVEDSARTWSRRSAPLRDHRIC